MADGAPALDPSVLDTLRQLTEEGQPDVLKEVLRLFIGDAPARLDAVSRAIADRDAPALQRAAHTLKGAAGTIGAMALQHASRELEEMGRDSRLDDAAAAADVLRVEFARVRTAIDQLL